MSRTGSFVWGRKMESKLKLSGATIVYEKLETVYPHVAFVVFMSRMERQVVTEERRPCRSSQCARHTGRIPAARSVPHAAHHDAGGTTLAGRHDSQPSGTRTGLGAVGVGPWRQYELTK